MSAIDDLLKDRITNIEFMRLGDIQDHPRNPKVHPARQGRALHGVVNQIGWAGVPLVYKSERLNGTLTFVDDHLRKQEFPDATVRVAITDLTDAEADALLITYDPIAQLAETNKEEFERLLADVRPENPEMKDLLETLARKFKLSYGDTSPDEDPSAIDRAAEIQQKWQVESGQIWELDSGNGVTHRVICGDSTDAGVIASLMAGDHARMCMTDPPYNVDYGANTPVEREGIANDNLDAAAWLTFVHNFATRIKENCTGDVYIWGAGVDTSGERMRLYLVDNLAMHWSSTIIWVKDQFTLGRSKYQHQNEIAFYGRFKKSSFNDESRNQTDVWQIERPSTSSEHPTMKPVELLMIGIRNSSRPGDIVIDYFLGSGSTLLACESLGRACRGAELDPKYVAVTLERWTAQTNAQPKLLYPKLRIDKDGELLHALSRIEAAE